MVRYLLSLKESLKLCKMKKSLLFMFFFSICNLQGNEFSPGQSFDKQVFYRVLSSGNLIQLNEQLVSIKSVPLPDKDAYEGALLMKKAGLIDNKKTQLSLFRNGKQKLESAILKKNENCEFRLLRLIIQENAPPFLGYNKQIEEDCLLIKKLFAGSAVLLQNIILDYSKTSPNLKISDF